MQYYWIKRFYDNKAIFPKIKKQPLLSIPIKPSDYSQQKKLIQVIEKIENKPENIEPLQHEINLLVYSLYGLRKKEIETIECETM